MSLAVTTLLAPVLGALTCDVRLAEESKYSSFANMDLLGISINKSICMNDYYSSSDRVNARRCRYFLSSEDDGNDALSRL